jgi:molybdate transport system substrate-binding protein
MKTQWVWLLICLGSLVLVSRPSSAQSRQPITVFAAASLTDAFVEIKDDFEQQYPNIEIFYQFGSSSKLATQLIEGAEADVFASADRVQMSRVQAADLLLDEARPFIGNRLLIIAPADNPAQITNLADLGKPGMLLITTVPGVPLRVYTEQMLVKAEATGEYGENFTTRVFANITSEEDNARQAVAKILLGEGDGAIVYASDAKADEENLTVVFIPEAVNVTAVLYVGQLSTTSSSEVGALLMAFLQDEGQAILKAYGFLTLEEIKSDLATPEPTLEPTAAATQID